MLPAGNDIRSPALMFLGGISHPIVMEIDNSMCGGHQKTNKAGNCNRAWAKKVQLSGVILLRGIPLDAREITP